MRIVIEWRQKQHTINAIQPNNITLKQIRTQALEQFNDLPSKFTIQYYNQNSKLIASEEVLEKIIISKLSKLNNSPTLKNQPNQFQIIKLYISQDHKLLQSSIAEQMKNIEGKIQGLQIQYQQTQKLQKKNGQKKQQVINCQQKKQNKNLQYNLKNQQQTLLTHLESMNISVGKRLQNSTIQSSIRQSEDDSSSQSSQSSSQPIQQIKQKKIQTQYDHQLKCLECNNTIIGIRYKCTICVNFDICQQCQSKLNHDEEHALLKVKKMLPYEYMNKKTFNNKGITWQCSQDLNKFYTNCKSQGIIGQVKGKNEIKQAKRKMKNQKQKNKMNQQLLSDKNTQAEIVSKAYELYQLLSPQAQLEKCQKISRKNPFKNIGQLVQQYFRKSKLTH